MIRSARRLICQLIWCLQFKCLRRACPLARRSSYDAYNGLGWTDSRGWRVFFGSNAKDMALKVRVYQALVDSVTARGLYPVFISVARVDAPYYRMEP